LLPRRGTNVSFARGTRHPQLPTEIANLFELSRRSRPQLMIEVRGDHFESEALTQLKQDEQCGDRISPTRDRYKHSRNPAEHAFFSREHSNTLGTAI